MLGVWLNRRWQARKSLLPGARVDKHCPGVWISNLEGQWKISAFHFGIVLVEESQVLPTLLDAPGTLHQAMIRGIAGNSNKGDARNREDGIRRWGKAWGGGYLGHRLGCSKKGGQSAKV